MKMHGCMGAVLGIFGETQSQTNRGIAHISQTRLCRQGLTAHKTKTKTITKLAYYCTYK